MNWNNTTLREREKASIEAFVRAQADKLGGKTLDWGCGLQPYRSIVEEAGGDYRPFDRTTLPGSTVSENVGDDWPLKEKGGYDAILCTQVIQYVTDPRGMLGTLWASLKPGGWLVLTGPTNWPEVEGADHCRFTVSGIAYMLARSFTDVDVASRDCIEINNFALSLGWGAVARRPEK